MTTYLQLLPAELRTIMNGYRLYGDGGKHWWHPGPIKVEIGPQCQSGHYDTDGYRFCCWGMRFTYGLLLREGVRGPSVDLDLIIKFSAYNMKTGSHKDQWSRYAYHLSATRWTNHHFPKGPT